MTHRSAPSLARAAEAYYEEIRQFVHQRTGSASLAEEVVQETWIRARGVTGELPNNPRAYLYRMAGNLAVDQIRRERVRAGPAGAEEISPDEPANVESLPSPAPNPLETAISRQELSVLNEAVSELPQKCRDVFLLYRGRGMSMREVSWQLGISEKTVEKHIARAMVHCRQRLRKAGRSV